MSSTLVALPVQRNFLLERQWEAGLREAFDYQRLLDSLLPKDTTPTEDAPEAIATERLESDQAATAAWLEGFRQTLRQREWQLGVSEYRRGPMLDPLTLGLAGDVFATTSDSSHDSSADEDDLIRQWRLSRLENAGSQSQIGATAAPRDTRHALGAYGGIALLASTAAGQELLPANR